MKQIIKNDYDAMCKEAAQEIINTINAKGGNAVIGLATGNTPKGVYKELVRRYNEGEVDFSKVTTFNLDEYIVDPAQYPNFINPKNLAKSDPRSYHYFMEDNLFKYITKGGPKALKRENIHIPNATVKDYGRIKKGDYTELNDTCAKYEADIKAAGGIDLQLVGIGKNGHVGFCEPGSDPKGRTSVVKLTDETIQSNMEKCSFAGEYAMSMGLGTIKDAKKVLLIANGDEKAPVLGKIGDVVQRGPMVDGVSKSDWQLARLMQRQGLDTLKEGNPLHPRNAMLKIPALVLLEHPNTTAILDPIAARNLSGNGLSTEAMR